jgi:hypothetical protein
MAIKGLTDRGAQFPRIGTLRKGAERPEDGKRPGADLKWFRFDSDDEEAVRAFQESYGTQPTHVNVYLPYQSTGQNFEAWQEAWSASALIHRCDGVTMTRWLGNDNKYHDDPQPCTGGCKAVGRLMVIIPELRRFAYVTVQTTSKHDIMTLQSNLEAAEMLRGDLRGIPFVVSRRPREISTPRDGKDGKSRMRAEKWLLSIEPAPTWVRYELAAMERAALPAGTLKALPDGRSLNIVDGEILDDPELEDDESEEQPPSPPPAVRLTAAARTTAIKRIRAMWADERDMTDDLAAQNTETDADLERLADDALMRLGQTVKARIEALQVPAAVTTT